MNNVLVEGTRSKRMVQPERRQVPVIIGMPKQLIDNLDAEANRLGLDSRAELVRRLCANGLQPKAA